MDQQQQPIIVKTGGGISTGAILTGALVIGAGAYFGHKWWVEHVADKEAGKLDTPEAQIASKIYNAKHWYGDSPKVAFDAAREIANKKLIWKNIADAFQKLYNDNINNYLDFLSAEEKATFFNIFNFTTSSKTATPPAAKLQFDVKKNPLVFIAKNNVNIRKSPKVLGGGTADSLDPTYLVHKSNVIRIVPKGKVLGVATGKSEADNTGTLFYEFTALIFDGTKSSTTQKLWAAASQLDKKEFTYWKEAGDYYYSACKAGTGAYFKQSEFLKATS